MEQMTLEMFKTDMIKFVIRCTVIWSRMEGVGQLSNEEECPFLKRVQGFESPSLETGMSTKKGLEAYLETFGWVKIQSNAFL